MYPLHRRQPQRRNPQPTAKNYKTFKDELREDFNQRCGYCNDQDLYFGCKQGFHIDHFAPKSEFPKLENKYGNLVYSCPICNWAKSDKWFTDCYTKPHNGKEGFVDPCSPEFNDHLERSNTGMIMPLTPVGECIISNLKLNLKRHQILWVIEELQMVSDKLSELKCKYGNLGSLNNDVCEKLAILNCKIKTYTEMVRQ